MTGERAFLFRLSLALGVPNPDSLLACLPYRIYQEWRRYAELEPFGEERADLRSAILSALVANAWLRGKNRPAYKISDFMPKFGPPEPRQTRSPDDLHAKMLAIFGGRVERVETDGD